MAILLATSGMIQAHAHLIGISNKTGKGAPTPRIGISNTPITSIPYTANNVGLQNIKINLPVEVTLTYDKTINEGKPYTIVITESGQLGTCQGNTREINAWIKEGNKEATTQKCCVTLAKNSFSNLKEPYEWENIILAIANNPEYGTNTKALPFIFGIAPWTTTKFPWNKTTVLHPSDTKSITFNHVWDTLQEAGLIGLKVMQGNCAWMGGDITQNILPRKGYNHIVHIYNNTPYVINITRNVRQYNLSASNFNQLLPPWTATPWAMAWIPTIPSSTFNPDIDQQLSAIQIYALYAPEKDEELLPGQLPIIKSTGQTEYSQGKSANELLAGLESNHSEYISKLLGETPIKDLMPDIDKDQYAVGNSYFRVFTLDNQNGKTIIQKCDNISQECSEMKSIAAPNTHPLFGYFKLIINEDEKHNIKLELSPIPLENVLED